MEKQKIDAPTIARLVGCSFPTLGRILAGKTRPTDEFIKQVGILLAIGLKKYQKLTKSEKEKISEKMGAVGGGVLGFGSISAAVSASGAVAGLSAAGITSGLAAIGAIVGGGMAAGVAVAAAIPLAVGAAGYAVIKGVKYFFSESELKNEKINPRWEQEDKR